MLPSPQLHGCTPAIMSAGDKARFRWRAPHPAEQSAPTKEDHATVAQHVERRLRPVDMFIPSQVRLQLRRLGCLA